MQKKSILLKVLNGLKEEYLLVRNEIINLEKRVDLTEEGKKEFKRNVYNRYSESIKKGHDKATSIITEQIIVLEQKAQENTIKRLTDAGYNIGLSNVIKAIELGAISNNAEFKNIISAYEQDYFALSTIKAALKESSLEKNKEYIQYVPINTTEKGIELLNQLKANLDRYINIEHIEFLHKNWNLFNPPFGDFYSSINGMIDFIETRLNDNLELIQ